MFAGGYEVQGAGVSNPPHYVNFTSRVESVCLDNCQHGLEGNEYDDVIPGSLQNIYNGIVYDALYCCYIITAKGCRARLTS